MTGAPDVSGFATTPKPPFYAVIFTSLRREGDEGYAEMTKAMEALALSPPGCLGMESARNADEFGLTVSYFAREADVLAWKRLAEHLVAQKLGRERWYAHYEVRVAKVERAYAGPRGRGE